MDLTVIGQRVRAAREAANITQEDLGRAVGCTAKHIGAIERGIKTPRLDTFIIIAKTTGVSADYLVQDLLEKPTDSLAGELSAATALLDPKTQKRMLRAIQAFARDDT